MADEDERASPDDEREKASGRRSGDPSSDREPVDGWEEIAPAEGERFELGWIEPVRADEDHRDEEQSRVEGMPDGWLEEPTGVESVAAVAPDAQTVTSPDDDPEASGVSHASRVQIGTGHSGIVSPSDVISAVSSAEARSVRAVIGDSQHADAIVAGSAEGPPAADAGPVADGGKTADEWRDIIASVRDEVPSESVGFGGFVGGAEANDPAIADSYHGDSQGIDESHGEPLDLGSLGMAAAPSSAAGTIVTSARPGGGRKGGLGQLLGVVLGGLLAIPVTLAILLYGFQRDPFQIASRVPDGLRFLLPSRFRAVDIDRRVASSPAVAMPSTLDQLPASRLPADEPVESGGEEGVAADVAPLIAGPTEPEVRVVEPSDGAAEGTSGLTVADPLEDVQIVVEPVPLEHAGTIADPVRAAGIDYSHVDGAVAAAISATENLAVHADGDPSAQDQALVGWYRRLSVVADESAKAERSEIEAARPASEVVAKFAELSRRLSGQRLDDLEILGAMWLASEKRPSDGAMLVATLEAAHPVGPWWGGRLAVAGDTPRTLSFLARSEPRAEPGQRVIVVGVLGDSGTIWAVDVGPLPAAEETVRDGGDAGQF